MHTVKETGTFTSQDGSKSTYLVAGDQISDEDAADLGLASEQPSDQPGEQPKADQAKEGKSAGAAPENKAR